MQLTDTQIHSAVNWELQGTGFFISLEAQPLSLFYNVFVNNEVT